MYGNLITNTNTWMLPTHQSFKRMVVAGHTEPAVVVVVAAWEVAGHTEVAVIHSLAAAAAVWEVVVVVVVVDHRLAVVHSLAAAALEAVAHTVGFAWEPHRHHRLVHTIAVAAVRTPVAASSD